MKKEAMLYEKLENNNVQCRLCNHKCIIKEDNLGICKVRQNIEGTLYSLVYGELIAASVDPIEKKPIFHMFPGSKSYSIATVGCNLKCGFCQNWQISQSSQSHMQKLTENYIPPEEIAEKAIDFKCKSISYTYTEPTIFFEYAYDVAKKAKEKGLYNIFVSNGFMTREAIDLINPYLDAANIDLKSFNENFYNKICKAKLKPVLDNIKHMKESGIIVEITTLIIPGENDNKEEINDLIDFILSVSNDIPWHINRFHPDYQFLNHKPTDVSTLEEIYKIAKNKGLKHVYIGNTMNECNTFCDKCGIKLIERGAFTLYSNNIINGKCNSCGNNIYGLWE